MRHLGLSLIATTGMLLAADPAPAQQFSAGTTLAYPYAGAPYPIPYASAPTTAVNGGYAHYGFPGNYYAPTVQSYGPYAPNMGPTAAYYGMPIFSITYQNGDGTPSTYVQSGTGYNDAVRNYYNAGYRGYSAPSPYYSYGQSGVPFSSPSVPSYGGSAFNPSGTYSHYVTPGAPTAPMTSGTMGFGVTPNQ